MLLPIENIWILFEASLLRRVKKSGAIVSSQPAFSYAHIDTLTRRGSDELVDVFLGYLIPGYLNFSVKGLLKSVKDVANSTAFDQSSPRHVH